MGPSHIWAPPTTTTHHRGQITSHDKQTPAPHAIKPPSTRQGIGARNKKEIIMLLDTDLELVLAQLESDAGCVERAWEAMEHRVKQLERRAVTVGRRQRFPAGYRDARHTLEAMQEQVMAIHGDLQHVECCVEGLCVRCSEILHVYREVEIATRTRQLGRNIRRGLGGK